MIACVRKYLPGHMARSHRQTGQPFRAITMACTEKNYWELGMRHGCLLHTYKWGLVDREPWSTELVGIHSVAWADRKLSHTAVYHREIRRILPKTAGLLSSALRDIYFIFSFGAWWYVNVYRNINMLIMIPCTNFTIINHNFAHFESVLNKHLPASTRRPKYTPSTLLSSMYDD